MNRHLEFGGGIVAETRGTPTIKGKAVDETLGDSWTIRL